MKLARFVHASTVQLGLVDVAAGTVTPLASSAPHGDAMIALISAALSGVAPRTVSAALPLAAVQLLPPIAQPSKNLLCIGKNYAAHAAEFTRSGYDSSAQNAQDAVPAAPIVFTKAPCSMTGAKDDIMVPWNITSQVDYEGELGVVIGKPGRGISRAAAYEHVWAYCVINDATARDLQARHKQWLLGKSIDTFCPIGPWLTTADEVAPSNLELQCWVNGELRQQANTRDLIFDIPTIIESISASMSLEIGDIIALPVEENLLVAIRNAKTYLDYGFTAVIGVASAKPRLELVVRNAVNKGEFPGPRILASSPEYTVSGGLGDDSRLDLFVPSIGMVCNGADEFRKSIRQLIREGVDIIKFNNSGDSITFGRMPGDINPMTEDEVRAICETTLNVGKRLAAHAHTDSGVRQCMQYGVELINHATFASDATIEALAKVADQHWVTPAIAARYNTTYEAGAWGITTEIAESIGIKRELEAGCANMQKMHRAGIRVLPFGDYGFAWIPIGTDCRDLEHMVNLFDMQPWEALRAATAYSGEAWAGNSGEKLGRIRVGYLADILLIDGDPLADLSLLHDQRRILAVMKDGQFHRRFNGHASRAAGKVAA